MDINNNNNNSKDMQDTNNTQYLGNDMQDTNNKPVNFVKDESIFPQNSTNNTQYLGDDMQDTNNTQNLGDDMQDTNNTQNLGDDSTNQNVTQNKNFDYPQSEKRYDSFINFKNDSEKYYPQQIKENIEPISNKHFEKRQTFNEANKNIESEPKKVESKEIIKTIETIQPTIEQPQPTTQPNVFNPQISHQNVVDKTTQNVITHRLDTNDKLSLVADLEEQDYIKKVKSAHDKQGP